MGISQGMWDCGRVNAPKAFAKAKAALTYKPDSIQSTPTLLLTFDNGVYEASLHRISRSVDFEVDLIAIVPAQLREPFKNYLGVGVPPNSAQLFGAE